MFQCVPIQNQSEFSFIQCPAPQSCPTQVIKVMITLPAQILAVIQLLRHKPLTPTTPRSWAVYLSSSMQWHWHWKTSWHLVTCGHVMAGVWNVNDETHHIWMSTQQNGYMRLGAACSLFLSWEEKPVTALGRMEFHVNLSTINNEANTDVCWKWWPIRAARQRKNFHY